MRVVLSMTTLNYIVLSNVTPNRGTVAAIFTSERQLVAAIRKSGTPRAHARKTRFPVKRGDRIWTSDTRLV